MKAYIQRLLGEIPDDWVFSAMLGFKNKGFDIKYFEEENLENLPCNKDTVLVAYIEPTIKYFELNNIPVPNPLNIPDELNKFEYIGRTIGQMTMGELKGNSFPKMFVKPFGKVKQFESGPIDDNLKRYVFNDVPLDALVQTSTLIDFITEYRCFIHNGEIKGIHWYRGDFTIFPDMSVVKKMIAEYKSAPIAYTLDVGVAEDQWPSTPFKGYQTYLVECNDMWSVGHYGLREDIYSTLLRDRWFEITR